MPDRTPTQEHRPLPPLAWVGIVGGAVLAVVLVALLGLTLAVLTDSRNHIRAQDAKITRLLEGSRPALRQAGPAVREARPLIRAATPLAREARAALAAFRGTVPDLATAAEDVPRLMRADETLVTVAIPVLRDLQAAALPRVLSALPPVLSDAASALAQVRATDLIDVAAHSARLAPVLIYLQRRLLRVQKTTLHVQRDSRAIQARTLRIQRKALRHIESIDRKTGGQVPPVTPAAP
jgi:hypothetical protein